jgi:hypothetical protein
VAEGVTLECAVGDDHSQLVRIDNPSVFAVDVLCPYHGRDVNANSVYAALHALARYKFEHVANYRQHETKLIYVFEGNPPGYNTAQSQRARGAARVREWLATVSQFTSRVLYLPVEYTNYRVQPGDYSSQTRATYMVLGTLPAIEDEHFWGSLAMFLSLEVQTVVSIEVESRGGRGIYYAGGILTERGHHHRQTRPRPRPHLPHLRMTRREVTTLLTLVFHGRVTAQDGMSLARRFASVFRAFDVVFDDAQVDRLGEISPDGTMTVRVGARGGLAIGNTQLRENLESALRREFGVLVTVRD